MTGPSFLQRFARQLPRHLDLQPDDDGGEAVAEWTRTRRWEDDGHRFEGLGRAGNGDHWYAWHYRGLEGPPPVVFLGDGDLEVVADTVEAFLWQLADRDTYDEEDEPAHARFRALLAEHVPRPSAPPRSHPDFHLFLQRYEEPLELYEPVPTLAPFAEARARGWVREALDGALADEEIRSSPAPMVLLTLAGWAMEVGDFALAEQLYTRGHDRTSALRAVKSAGRVAELEARLAEVGETLISGGAADLLDGLDPAAVRRAILEVDRRKRPWAPRIARTVDLPPRRRREVLLRFVQEYAKYPVGVATLRVEIARTWLLEGKLPAAREELEEARRLDVPDVANAIAALERDLAAPPPPPEKKEKEKKEKKTKKARAREVEDRPSDRPIVEELAKSRRRSFDRVVSDLAAAFADAAGEGATATFDGERFHLTRGGEVLDVDRYLDAAVDRLG